MRALIAAATIAAVLAGAGCAPPDTELRRARLDAERRNLEATFDRLEDRLLANQARVRLWKELRARHESVAAVACASLDQHAEEMAKRVLPESPAAGRTSLRVASAGETRSSRGATE